MSNLTASIRHTRFYGALPLLAFSLAICLLVVCFYGAGHTSLPPTEKRYISAKAGVASLRQDGRRNMQREPWEKLATEFKSIYETDPAWPNRPAALFRAAEALEELARRSCSRADARKAINCYESLALKHGQSRLADDALFRAARLRAAMLKDDSGALALLARIRKQYPKGDMLPQAQALEKAIRASSNGKTAPDALKTASLGLNDALDDLQPQKQATTKGKFAGDIPLRFKAAQSRMAKLRKDSTRSCWRQPWENLREEFLKIRKQSKNAVAGASLYHAAECQQAIAICSRLAADRKKAIELFRQMAKEFARHELADDALLAAATLEYSDSKKNGPQTAISTLNTLLARYPKGDRAGQARKLLAQWKSEQSGQQLADSTARATRKSVANPELQVLSWDSLNKNNVEIVLELSAPTAYTTRLEKSSGGRDARLLVDLKDTDVVRDIGNGVKVNGSLLKAVKVSYPKKGIARLQFDFREAKRFDAHAELNPARIVLNVTAGKGRPEKSRSTGAQMAQNTSRLRSTQVNDLASQLGLTVKRVFLDAGHGGKDPGTSHNKIVERDITLDIALSLGKLLEANGMEVIYSRTGNKGVPLSERTRMANAANADIFVSIHVNANDNAAACGLETYYLDLATNKQAARVAMLENAASDKRLGDMQSMLTEVMLHARANESRRLAADIQRLTISRLTRREYSTRSNGVKSAPFHVLLGARMPAVLVEVGYCSNRAEARNLSTAKYRQALAVGLAEGIAAYRDRLLRNRTADKALTPKKANAI